MTTKQDRFPPIMARCALRSRETRGAATLPAVLLKVRMTMAGKPIRSGWKPERPDGRRQQFTFAQHHGFIESHQPIPEPHEFIARLGLHHETHSHDYEIGFAERHPHHHTAAVSMLDAGGQDAHERAHADDIRRRFANREVTTGQIVLFGLTGGLIPCPASITVLLLCLQLKKAALGATYWYSASAWDWP